MADIVFSAAGRTAMVGHITGGTNAFGTGSKLVLGTGQYTPDGTETGVSAPMTPAREYAISGVVSSGIRFSLGFVESNLTQVWNAGEIAIHGTGGVYYGIVSQLASDGWLVPKVAGSHAQWAAEVTLDSGTTANISFTITYNFPDATDSTKGKVYVATGLSDNRDDAAVTGLQVKTETDAIRGLLSTETAARLSADTALDNDKQDTIVGAPGQIHEIVVGDSTPSMNDGDWLLTREA